MSDFTQRTDSQHGPTPDPTSAFPSPDQRVFVIDDDGLSRESVTALVDSMGMKAVAFESAEEFLSQYRCDQAGCVVTDLRLRGMSGLELLDTLAQQDQAIPVILVTGFAKTHLTVRAVKTGAVTVLEKPYDDEDLWNAIRNALLQDQQRRSEQQRQHELIARFEKLTAQEREVLDLIVGGLTNKEMADKLGVSTRTIESRRHNVFQKTEAKSIAELVKMALAIRGVGSVQGS